MQLHGFAISYNTKSDTESGLSNISYKSFKTYCDNRNFDSIKKGFRVNVRFNAERGGGGRSILPGPPAQKGHQKYKSSVPNNTQ